MKPIFIARKTEKQKQREQREAKLKKLKDKGKQGKLTLEDLDVKLDIILELLEERL